jgi:hypothetical protein
VANAGRTVRPVSSGHIFSLRTFVAMTSASFRVSLGATAAKTNTPLLIEDINCLSTLTEAEATL